MTAKPFGAKQVKRIATFVSALAVLSPMRNANAQSPAPAPTSTEAQSVSPTTESQHVRDLMRRGFAAFDANNYESARALLLEAWTIRKSYDVAAALGQCEIELRQYRDAAEHLDYALHNFAPKEKPALEAQIQDGLTLAKQYVATLQVQITPATAELRVDNVAVRLPPGGTLYVEPGAHVIEASQGVASDRREITVAAGRDHHVDLHVSPGAPATASTSVPNPGDTPPNAQPPTASRPTWIPIVTGGLALAGTATWLGFWAASSSARDDAQKYQSELGPSDCTSGAASPTTCDSARDAYDRSRTNATISHVGLGVAIAGGAATLGYFLFWPRAQPSTATGITLPTVRVSRSEATVVFDGKF